MHELPSGDGDRPLPALLIVPAVDSFEDDEVIDSDDSSEHTGDRSIDANDTAKGGTYMSDAEQQAASATSSPPSSPSSHRSSERPAAVRWYCSRERVVLGVAGGLADSLALDPVVVRLMFVGMTVLSPFGIVVYLAARLAMAATRGAPEPSRWRRLIAAAAAAGGIIGLVNTANTHLGAWKFVAVLVGLSAALWYAPRAAEPGEWRPPILGGGRPPRDPQARGPQAGHWSASSGSHSTGGSDEAPSAAAMTSSALMPTTPTDAGEWPAPPTPSRPRTESLHAPDEPSAFPTSRDVRQRRKRSAFGRIVAAVAIAIVAVGALAGGSPAQMRVACIAAAAVCGVGIIAGRKFGSARWLIIPGLVAVGGAVVASAVAGLGVRIGAPWNGQSRYDRIATQADVPVVDFRAGQHELDLSTLSGDVSITAKAGYGSLVVRVPPDAHVTMHARVGLGVIYRDADIATGYRRDLVDEWGPLDGHRVDLDLTVGVGTVIVNRMQPTRYPLSATVATPIEVTPSGVLIYNGATVLADAILLDDGSESTPAGHRPSRTAFITDDGWMIAGDIQVAPDGTVYLRDGGVIPPPWIVQGVPADSVLVTLAPPAIPTGVGAPAGSSDIPGPIAELVTAVPAPAPPPNAPNASTSTSVPA